jgi:hypothetical protein
MMIGRFSQPLYVIARVTFIDFSLSGRFMEMTMAKINSMYQGSIFYLEVWEDVEGL